ncbi:MAG: PQQ-binding-like beta-propeller repeat protein [Acidobacteria bacterium]|nr:PQQ-binding-like beta-propeller repeat protein [Acidobacteriota bacterium]
MIGSRFRILFLVFAVSTPAVLAQVKTFTPVTREILLNPSPGDWLTFSRTYDNQRFSPLNQINRQNAGQLGMVWARGLAPGISETIPIVYQGVMYVANPGAVVQALDATSGDLIWEYRRKLPADLKDFILAVGRARSIAIFEDLIFYASPEGYLVALDARTGEVRWETMVHDYKTHTEHTTGPRVVDGKVLTGRGCGDTREFCFIAAHDARTGKELWKFFTTPAPGEPGGDSWGSVPLDKRLTSPWGLPGAYDPARKLVYWGTGNPSPHTRMKRHGGDVDDIPRSAPADLYSNSTVALDAETGKLAWYYQHVPGDDWDSDHTQERILFRTAFNPDPKAVKWINPGIPRGQERDVVVEVGEPGGLWVLDRTNGQFLWATPFPFDTPYFTVSHIDVETGKTYLNWDLVLKKDGDKQIICYNNTKSYWPMAYYPGKNALYIPYHDGCADTVADMKNVQGDHRTPIPRPGSDPSAFAGIAKVNMATGQTQRIYTARFPGNGAMLATAGDLIFWGDMNRRFRAFDADTGKILWETIVGGIIQNSTITYSVNGRQYVAVLTGDGVSGTGIPLQLVPELKPPRGHNAIYVFALPQPR